MNRTPPRCLILACGNTLRSDDGIGPWLADWAAQHFSSQPEIHVLSRQQWTPDLTEDIAQAESVLFIDCSVESAPGSIHIHEVRPASGAEGLATHHQDAPQLLALTRQLYNSLPRQAMLLTVGAGSTELGEEFSASVTAALPAVRELLEETVLRLLATPI
ncbi:MAG: hydrogenase maturation protease [Terracidiphilus sp.]